MAETRSPAEKQPSAEIKLCECGCGQPAPIATYTNRRRGYVRGRPRRFIHGHHRRGRRASVNTVAKRSGSNHYGWKGDGVGYSGLHTWVSRHKTKIGVCQDCGRDVGTNWPRGTQWANVSGEYRRDLDDFRELCTPCHRRFDLGRARPSSDEVVPGELVVGHAHEAVVTQDGAGLLEVLPTLIVRPAGEEGASALA